MQENAWTITVVLIALLAVIFLRVLLTSNRQAHDQASSGRPYAFRGAIFWLLILAGVVITFASLRPWPHATQAEAAQRVEVTGAQWSWQLSQTQVKAGVPVEFLVTSRDVNHGFGIYDASMRMLAQVQAMPGYTNKLLYTFEQPGEYHILCMEYCGVAHHNMTSTLTVSPAGE